MLRKEREYMSRRRERECRVYDTEGECFMSRKERGGEAERGWMESRGKEGRVPIIRDCESVCR